VNETAATLRRELPGLREGVPLAPLCAYGVGGPAEFLVAARSTDELSRAVTVGRQLGLPTVVLGQATNVLVADAGVRGLVVLARNAEVELADTVLTCGAGAVLGDLVTDLAGRGLAGLEFAANIPGSVGGALVGNAGAYGRAVGDALVRTELLTAAGPAQADPTELLLGYRTSALKASPADDRRSPSPLTGATVLRATFELRAASRSRLLEQIRRDAELRRSKHPLEYASCGSYFRNPSAVRPAARLIDEAGLKGLRVGRAEVSERHANFLVALDGATAADILALAEEVKRRVLEYSGVQLTEEAVRLGFD